MIPISKNGLDMASVHKFWYFLLVTYSFSLKILIFGLNSTYEIFRKAMAWASSQALHMVSFETFVKSMPPSLSELKVTPSFCFPFKIPDDPTETRYIVGQTKCMRQQVQFAPKRQMNLFKFCNAMNNGHMMRTFF